MNVNERHVQIVGSIESAWIERVMFLTKDEIVQHFPYNTMCACTICNQLAAPITIVCVDRWCCNIYYNVIRPTRVCAETKKITP
jgi:hypothetical protein